MSHLDRGLELERPPFEAQRFPVELSVFLLIATLAASPTMAAENAGLAFVLGPGSHLTVGSDEVPLPPGARIELVVEGRKVGGRFPVKASPAGLTMPAFDLGKEGQSLRVRMSAPATGWLTPGAEGLALELALTLQVEVTDGSQTRSGVYELALTTGAPVAAISEVAAQKGEAIDYGSRSARIVAATFVATDSPVAPGEPLAVVLDGTFEGLPAHLR